MALDQNGIPYGTPALDEARYAHYASRIGWPARDAALIYRGLRLRNEMQREIQGSGGNDDDPATRRAARRGVAARFDPLVSAVYDELEPAWRSRGRLTYFNPDPVTRRLRALEGRYGTPPVPRVTPGGLSGAFKKAAPVLALLAAPVAGIVGTIYSGAAAGGVTAFEGAVASGELVAGAGAFEGAAAFGALDAGALVAGAADDLVIAAAVNEGAGAAFGFEGAVSSGAVEAAGGVEAALPGVKAAAAPLLKQLLGDLFGGDAAGVPAPGPVPQPAAPGADSGLPALVGLGLLLFLLRA